MDVLDKRTIRALSADSRQTIMKMLAKRPYTASEIAKATGKHVTTMTEHLDTLESSGLIRKKDSTNKWVYYELTEKGEHLFKPKFYSWVVVLSLSVVFLFTGLLRLFEFDNTKTQAAPVLGSAPAMTSAAQRTTDAMQNTAYTVPLDYLAYLLVALGLIGFVYLVYRKWLSK